VRIEGEEAEAGPSPGLHSRDEPKVEREHERAEGLREPQQPEKEHQGRCKSECNGQRRCPGRTDECAGGTECHDEQEPDGECDREIFFSRSVRCHTLNTLPRRKVHIAIFRPIMEACLSSPYIDS
jgi:hypothetical protein